VRRHTRGRLLSALAMSMTLAACDRDILWLDDTARARDAAPDLPGASGDLATSDANDLASNASDLAGGPTDLAPRDLGAVDLGPARDGASGGDMACTPRSALDPCALFGSCHDMTTIDITFDGSGAVTAVRGSNGAALPQTVSDCYMAFFSGSCYPSLANTIQAIFPHCFIA
jgi:hypothetical protein